MVEPRGEMALSLNLVLSLLQQQSPQLADVAFPVKTSMASIAELCILQIECDVTYFKPLI